MSCDRRWRMKLECSARLLRCTCCFYLAPVVLAYRHARSTSEDCLSKVPSTDCLRKPWICCAECGVKVCAVLSTTRGLSMRTSDFRRRAWITGLRNKSANSPNPYFVPNIYSYCRFHLRLNISERATFPEDGTYIESVVTESNTLYVYAVFWQWE